MANRTFDAIKILSGQDDAVIVTVWWDGKTIQASSPRFIKQLKREEINGRQFSDGEEFFKALPRRYSNGYMYCKKATVDESGKEV